MFLNMTFSPWRDVGFTWYSCGFCVVPLASEVSTLNLIVLKFTKDETDAS